MRRHAIGGWLILHESAEPDPIARLVRSSHERWDGTGYPDGLSGDAIPLGARIITICDAYDAMTHDRPYRPARSVAEALEELRRGAGVRYDPTLVAVFADGRRAVALPGDARDPVGRPRRPGRPEPRVDREEAPADPRDGRRHVELAARIVRVTRPRTGRPTAVTTAIRLSRLRTT